MKDETLKRIMCGNKRKGLKKPKENGMILFTWSEIT